MSLLCFISHGICVARCCAPALYIVLDELEVRCHTFRSHRNILGHEVLPPVVGTTSPELGVIASAADALPSVAIAEATADNRYFQAQPIKPGIR